MTSRRKRGECRSCGATVLWCFQRNSKRWMPVDVEPVPTGNIRVFGDGLMVVLKGDELEQYREAGMKLHLSHFATCPEASAWRRRHPVRERAES